MKKKEFKKKMELFAFFVFFHKYWLEGELLRCSLQKDETALLSTGRLSGFPKESEN